VRTSLVGHTKSKALSAHLLPVCDGDCLCQCHMGGLLCPIQGGRRNQRGVQAPAPFLPASLSPGCRDDYWRTFQRSFSPGTVAIPVKPVVTHLQSSNHHRDPTLQSICTSTSDPDGKPACSAASVRHFPRPFCVVSPLVFSKSLQIYSSVTWIKISL